MGIYNAATRTRGTEAHTRCVLTGGGVFVAQREGLGQLPGGFGSELGLVGWMDSFTEQIFTDTYSSPGTEDTRMSPTEQTRCSESYFQLGGHIQVAATPKVTRLLGREPQRVRHKGKQGRGSVHSAGPGVSGH